jgi:hypothetical protein
VAALQATFYVGTGIWPLVQRRSFERVTGPKADFWLAQTVGVTVAAVGLGLPGLDPQSAIRTRFGGKVYSEGRWFGGLEKASTQGVV